MPNSHSSPRSRRLTRNRHRLVEELREITSLLQLNYEDVAQYDPAERTARLKLMRNQLVRSEVIMKYTLIDEHLSTAVCHYFFGKKSSFINLWKTKCFRTFNYYVVEVLSVAEKLRLVKAVTTVPKAIATFIDRLSTLRNGVAHAFFPENLRAAKPIYRGKDIFSVEGLTMFLEDAYDALHFFSALNFGVRNQVPDPEPIGTPATDERSS